MLQTNKNMKYGKLLIEGVNYIPLFEVVEPDRLSPDTITIEFSDSIADASGVSQKTPVKWANFWFCHDSKWGESHTNAIKDAISIYDANNPESPIPGNQVMIWEDGEELTKNDLLSD